MVEEVRRALMEGRCCVPAVGSVNARVASCLPFVVVDADVARWSRSVRICGIWCWEMSAR